ncbi:MAG: type III-A CRISPR-associated RAMP protein Csm3 [Candidatus Obscuribacterales bacterium]|jgi:CRISPR-associated protein Csm3|nr:type III-A CRISPR-associated RAMP protein Csm3 [Candidatus Obscuribacterales bacterium]
MNFIGRVFIKGQINVLTGLHIGTGGSGGIGLVDNPVIRDPLTRRPIIPGSTIKGRLRHALEIVLGTESQEVWRLFGAKVDAFEKKAAGRIMIRDAHLTDESALALESVDTDSLYVEIKTENRIDRARGVAEHPRQSERLPAGAVLDFEIVYSAWEKNDTIDDLHNIEVAMRFVEDEYIGGSGTRGYGKVEFNVLNVAYKSVDHYRSNEEGMNLSSSRKLWTQQAAEMMGFLPAQGGRA